jgi:hypothetical protein
VFWNALIEISAMGLNHPSRQSSARGVTPPTEGCRLRTAAGAGRATRDTRQRRAYSRTHRGTATPPSATSVIRDASRLRAR